MHPRMQLCELHEMFKHTVLPESPSLWMKRVVNSPPCPGEIYFSSLLRDFGISWGFLSTDLRHRVDGIVPLVAFCLYQ